MKHNMVCEKVTLKCLDQRVQDTLILEKTKLLVGSAENCDIILNDQSISSYHAMIFLQGGDGFLIKDLSSEAGIFVNGKRVDQSFVSFSDVITLGTISFSVEGKESDTPILNPDRLISRVIEQNAVFELPAKEGLVFIDGEYCDIKFDESSFKPVTHLPSPNLLFDFVDLDETVEPLEIIHDINTKRLEIVTYMNGLIMDIIYLDLKNGEFYLDSVKGRNSIPFYSLTKTKLFTIKKGQLTFHPVDSLSSSVPWDKIVLDEPLFLTLGTEQISLRFVDKGHDFLKIPMFIRDREFFKQSGKVFATVFLPILLLLFVSIPVQQAPEESVAVVYKLPEQIKHEVNQEKSDLSSEVVTSKVVNTGNKESQQDPAKVESSAASASQKVLAKNMAPSAPAAATKLPVVKSYEFNSSVSMTSFAGDAPNITAGSNNSKSRSDESFNMGTSDKADLVAGADIGVSKFNGSDKTGRGAASYGSKGLVSKSGFDSSYLEPKTVVLGSMDPEILRKILREYIPQFRHCYQQELVGHSDKIKGVIDLNFTISPEGRVAKHNIRAKDARFSQKGIGCMGQVLGLIDFPRPKGGGVVDVKQPLNFFAETEKI